MIFNLYEQEFLVFKLKIGSNMDAIRHQAARYVAGKTSVVDSHHFDADPDSTHHSDADSYSDFYLMRIRIQILASKKRIKPSKKC